MRIMPGKSSVILPKLLYNTFVFVRKKLSQLACILVLLFRITFCMKERRKGERTVLIKKKLRLDFGRTLNVGFLLLL